MTELPTLTRQEISLTRRMPEGTEFERNNGLGDWTISLYPSWDWHGYIYRPVAPEGWKHTDSFREPQHDDYYLDWRTGKQKKKLKKDDPMGRHWILEPDTPEEEPEEPDEMAYEIFPPQTGWELTGLEIDGRVFDRYSWPNHSPLGFSKHIFHLRDGNLPTHAIFRRPDK